MELIEYQLAGIKQTLFQIINLIQLAFEQIDNFEIINEMRGAVRINVDLFCYIHAAQCY